MYIFKFCIKKDGKEKCVCMPSLQLKEKHIDICFGLAKKEIKILVNKLNNK